MGLSILVKAVHAYPWLRMNLRKGCDTKYGPKLTDCPDPGAWSRLSDTTKADTKSGAPNSLGLIASAKAWYSVSYVVIHKCRPLGLEKPLYWYFVFWVCSSLCLSDSWAKNLSTSFAWRSWNNGFQASMLHSSFRAAKLWGFPTLTEEDEQVWSPLNYNFDRSKRKQELI